MSQVRTDQQEPAIQETTHTSKHSMERKKNTITLIIAEKRCALSNYFYSYVEDQIRFLNNSNNIRSEKNLSIAVAEASQEKRKETSPIL